MALTQRGINIPVTGQIQDGDDVVDALIAQGMSVDAALGSLEIPSTPGDIGAAAASHQHAAGDISSGTLDVARVPNLPASKITSGTIAPARLGTGTADDTKFLRGDGTWQAPPGGGGGVTDHGALTGLADDDHPQYHNDARGDARYYTKTQVDTALTGKADASRGLPSGGSTGQVLAKASGSNYDTEWVDPPEGGGGGGGVPLVASTAVGKWFTYPLFMSMDLNQYLRANKDMPLIITEAMSIDAVTMTVGTAPSEETAAVINLLDASRTFVQKVCDLPIPTATGDVTAVFTPIALSPGVYHLETVGVGYGEPGNFGAKFTCGKVIGWDAGQGLSSAPPPDATFPRRTYAAGSFAPVTPMIWVRRSA